MLISDGTKKESIPRAAAALSAVFWAAAGFLLVLLWRMDAANTAAKLFATGAVVTASCWFPLACAGRPALTINKIRIGANALFVLVCVLAYSSAVFVIPPGTAPDEPMRYQLTEFILKYGELPRGDDPRLLDSTWGISYAFFPYLSNLISVLLQRIYLLFDPVGAYLLYAARMAGVLVGGITAFLAVKISGHLFSGVYKWVMLVLFLLLPQYIYLCGYVNNDGLAILSGTLIVYAWIHGARTSWRTGSLVLLAVGISVCALSYYNAYGYILSSVVLLAASWRRGRYPLSTAIKKAGMIAGVCLLLAGWWFVRQGILYGGDIFGIAASNASAELHAVDALKPSLRQSLVSGAAGWRDLMASLFLWVKMSFRSAVAIFGIFAVYVPYGFYYSYAAIAAAGFGGALLRDKSAGTAMAREGRRFQFAVVLSTAIPVVLSLYNSLFVDYQPQGRYWLPGLVCAAILLTWGFEKVGMRLRWGKTACRVLTAALTLLSLFSVFYFLFSAY